MRWLVLGLLLPGGCLFDSGGNDYQPNCPDPPSVAFRHHQVPVVPRAIAVGGAMDFSLVCLVRDLPGEYPLDRPSSIQIDSDAVGLDSGQLVGVHDGSATVHVMSPDHSRDYGSVTMTAEMVDHAAVEMKRVDLKGANTPTGYWLTDDRAQITLPAGCSITVDASFECSAAAPGAYTASVVSGGKTFTAPFNVP